MASNLGLGQVVSWYICTAVALVFLACRLWVRVRKLGAVSLEDAFLTLAGCCLLGDLIIQHYMWSLGMADPATATFDGFVNIMKMIVPGSILYVTSLWAIKIALVIFYKKITIPGSRMAVIYNCTLGFLVASWALIFFHIIFQCFPHDKRWSQDPSYQCDPYNALVNYWITIILNIFTDILIMSLPISVVLKLQMKTKQKIGVIAMFTLGVFVVITSIVRAYFSHRNETMLTCTVSMIETAVAIIAACLPPLRQFIMGSLSTGRGNSSYQQHYELSSSGQPRSRRTHQGSRITTNIVGGTKTNDSEDELVKNQGLGPFVQADAASHDADRDGITVTTTFYVQGTTKKKDRDEEDAVM
ncbi:hypothetical protein B0I35DRAFT_235024 [Stachybotrys elegans]|uniref:Rhodopsin domain-containing protein n=1 Tax=Stachybotrys elegans TaxID=80388 RepID=A0A8K0SRX7_9HYPO|nr:hypothetical protein B0I35DRAFT_235024 [Stachybotrys elegans]